MSLLNLAQTELQDNPEQHVNPLSPDLMKIKSHGNFSVEADGTYLRLLVDTSSFLAFDGYTNLANLQVMQASMDIMNVDELATLFLEGTIVLNLWAGKSGILVADFGPAKVFEEKREAAIEKKKKNLPPPAGDDAPPT